jgi:2-dehydro-3-deoxygluconokinase
MIMSFASQHTVSPDPQVVCVGEAMLMLAPLGLELLEQATCLAVSVGGSEANVAIGLERLGVHSSWIGKLPRNPLGYRVVQEIRAQGVDTSSVVWIDGGRVGLFFFERGAAPRPSVTIYDRENSAAATLSEQELDWDHVRRARWMHLSGISLALSPACRTSTREMMRRAHDLGVSVSFDLNNRALLWGRHNPREAWLDVLPFVDLLVTTEEDASTLLGTRLGRQEALRRLLAAHPHRAAIITIGKEGAVGYDGRQFCTAPGFEVHEVNRLGAGDAFVAGLLYGYMTSGLQAGLNYGTAMAGLKITIPQNLPLVAKADAERLIAGRVVELVR